MTKRKDLQDLYRLSRSPMLSYLKKQAEPEAPRPKSLDLPPRRPLLEAFSPQRIWHWITEYLDHRLGPRYPFQSYESGSPNNGVYTLPGDDQEIRIALAGDWATGTDEAYEIGQQMEAFKPHYTIHLGDVYYVGDNAEVDLNFLGEETKKYDACCWPKGSNGAFALIGNHEMFAHGGRAYFERMLPALGPIAEGRNEGQKASFFCLENEYWRIIGLDTGYNSIGLPLLEYVFKPDCRLRPEVLAWIGDVVKPDNDARGLILLSHHQYFSQFEDWYPKPATQLAKFISRPVLWFWGHEHRLAIYEEFGIPNGLRTFGRCVGHGGMPVELPGKQLHPECRLEFIDTRLYDNDEHLLAGVNGFVQITLRGTRLDAAYVDFYGAAIFKESWVLLGGALKRIDYCATYGNPAKP
ncbi:MAG: metallophosphoesterase family protein [Methylocella sp.]